MSSISYKPSTSASTSSEIERHTLLRNRIREHREEEERVGCSCQLVPILRVAGVLFVLMMYSVNIYFSIVFPNISNISNMPMWLAVNGYTGLYLVINSITHWLLVVLSRGGVWLFWIRMSYVVSCIFMSVWTVLGWIYLIELPNIMFPHLFSIPFRMFMWGFLSLQSILLIISFMVCYTFIKDFIRPPQHFLYGY
jgi:hypothetical protein